MVFAFRSGVSRFAREKHVPREVPLTILYTQRQRDPGKSPMVWPRSIWKEARSEKFFQVEADTILGRKRFSKGARTNAVQSKKRRTRMAPMKIEPKSEQNLDGYGAPLIPWSKIRDRLDQGFTQEPEKGGPNRHTCWLTTMRPDGRPHVVPLRAAGVDGAFYFTAGAYTCTAKTLALNPDFVLTVTT